MIGLEFDNTLKQEYVVMDGDMSLIGLEFDNTLKPHLVNLAHRLEFDRP